jgi:hypothetical protein
MGTHQRGTRCPIFKDIEVIMKNFVDGGGVFPPDAPRVQKNCPVCATSKHIPEMCPILSAWRELKEARADTIQARSAREQADVWALAQEQEQEHKKEQERKKEQEAARAVRVVRAAMEEQERERMKEEERKKKANLRGLANLDSVVLPTVDVLMGVGAQSDKSSTSTGAFTRLERAGETKEVLVPGGMSGKKHPPFEVKRLFALHSEADMMWMMMADLWKEHPERFVLRDWEERREKRFLEYTKNLGGEKPFIMNVVIAYRDGMPVDARFKAKGLINNGDRTERVICKWA